MLLASSLQLDLIAPVVTNLYFIGTGKGMLYRSGEVVRQQLVEGRCASAEGRTTAQQQLQSRQQAGILGLVGMAWEAGLGWLVTLVPMRHTHSAAAPAGEDLRVCRQGVQGV